MKSHHSAQKTAIGIGIVLLAVLAGCDIPMGGWSQARYEKTIEQQVACDARTLLDVATQSGSISITGADANECRLTARIVARAPTEEEARDLAEQVELRPAADSDTLKIRADKPDLANNRSLSVSYTLTVPQRMSVLAVSDYGGLEIVGMHGSVKGKSGSGSIRAEGIQGPLDLNTSYGSITCRDLAGPTTLLHSGSGSITVAELKGSAKLVTSYGSISCTGGSGEQLDLKSGSGSIKLSGLAFGNCLAVTDYGGVICNDFQGNALKLRSSSGSVRLGAARAGTVDLHTSYGRVEARQITTGEILANSGSGGIEILCSEACPADLKATAKSSYGSIAFQAPPRFAGAVHLATDYGSVHTELPITVTGGLDKNNVAGKIGAGTGSLDLQTASGSIDLK
jgi:DUF4097 and DUF4098 domain-containing protein YvlB